MTHAECGNGLATTPVMDALWSMHFGYVSARLPRTELSAESVTYGFGVPRVPRRAHDPHFTRIARSRDPGNSSPRAVRLWRNH
jgi:hypothetical protein